MRAIVAVVAVVGGGGGRGGGLRDAAGSGTAEGADARTASPWASTRARRRGTSLPCSRALAEGPKRAARALEALAAEQPNDPVVQFNYATALFCAGFDAEAVQAFRKAKKAGRDTRYQRRRRQSPSPAVLQATATRCSSTSGRDPLLIQGQVAQRNYHQVTAERLWARAAKLHPNDADAQVAAAVGRFDMDDLNASFSRLGPLVKRFPKSQTVRFHLALLLDVDGTGHSGGEGVRAARALGATTTLGKEANAFLDRLGSSGTKASKR